MTGREKADAKAAPAGPHVHVYGWQGDCTADCPGESPPGPATTGEPPDLRSALIRARGTIEYLSGYAPAITFETEVMPTILAVNAALLPTGTVWTGTVQPNAEALAAAMQRPTSPKAVSAAATGKPAALDWARMSGGPPNAFIVGLGKRGLSIDAREDVRGFTTVHVLAPELADAKAEAERIYRAAFGPRLSQAERDAFGRVVEHARRNDPEYLLDSDLATLAPLLEVADGMAAREGNGGGDAG